MIPKVAGWKKDRVSQLTDIFNSEGVVAVVDVSGVPASNMIDMFISQISFLLWGNLIFDFF